MALRKKEGLKQEFGRVPLKKKGGEIKIADPRVQELADALEPSVTRTRWNKHWTPLGLQSGILVQGTARTGCAQRST